MGSEITHTNRASWRTKILPRQAKKIAKQLHWKAQQLLLTLRGSFIYRQLRKVLSKVPRKIQLIIVLAIVGVGAYYIYSLSMHTSASTQGGSGTITAQKTHQPVLKTPDYPTLLPAGKSIADLGGWTRVSPPDRNPVFAYLDKIVQTQINVSEQPLPKEFKPDTNDQIDQLAQGFKANEKITVGSTIVHIGTSAKGPQTVIFYIGDTLIFIKSSVVIDNARWTEYVNSLQ